MKTHIINLDKKPFCPEGWKVEEHRKGGKFVWNPARISFHLEPEQGKGSIEGTVLRERLKDEPVLNANVLDYLLKNPRLIPEEWKRDENGNLRYIFFWGTIYRDPNSRLRIRCLYWVGDQWSWGCSWLAYSWNDNEPAAVLPTNECSPTPRSLDLDGAVIEQNNVRYRLVKI